MLPEFDMEDNLGTFLDKARKHMLILYAFNIEEFIMEKYLPKGLSRKQVFELPLKEIWSLIENYKSELKRTSWFQEKKTNTKKPKKKAAGSKRKKQNKPGTGPPMEVRRVRTPRENEVLGDVIQMLGFARILVDCQDKLGNVDHLFIEYHGKQDETQTLHRILDMLHQAGFRYHIKEAHAIQHPFTQGTRQNRLYDLQLNVFGFRI